MPAPTRRRGSHAAKARTRAKVSAYRARMRKMGLRPIQIWVPDVRSAAFRREIRRQCRLLAQDPAEPANQAFVDAISVWPGK